MSRKKVIIGIVSSMFILSGCSAVSDKQMPDTEGVAIQQIEEDDIREEIQNICRDSYKRAKQNRTLGSLESIQEIMGQLGQKGYAVFEQNNQLDMENYKDVDIFCQKVADKQSAELLLIMVLYNGDFVQFNLSTKAGKVDVSARSLSWVEDALTYVYTDNYQASEWILSENGYLFFEKYYMAGFSGPYSHVAVRVKPLDKIYRELNRKYILPIGYHLNNLFIVDWSEQDYQNLNFYDLFETLYSLEFHKKPYSFEYNEGTSQVPKEEFERVFMAYFNIDGRELKKKTRYVDSSKTYEYRPRGLYDSSSSYEIPYPEVINCENKRDGTIELTVNAVWPEMNLGTAFQHKVVIQPLEDGKYKYVSNYVIPSKNNVEPIWYVERLTEKEYAEYYNLK